MNSRADRSGQRSTLLAQNLHQLCPAPHVESAFAFFVGMGGIDYAVGIFGGPECALGRGHIAHHVIQRSAGGARFGLRRASLPLTGSLQGARGRGIDVMAELHP